jgi:hypothetical protein
MYAESFGVPRWTRFPDVAFGPDRTTYRGEQADYVIHVALGYAGPQQVELIQPVRGVDLYTEYLERSGPGVHHLAWVPDVYDPALARARSAGLAPAQAGYTDDMAFTYLETPAIGAHFVELMRLSPSIRSMFAALQAASVPGPAASVPSSPREPSR